MTENKLHPLTLIIDKDFKSYRPDSGRWGFNDAAIQILDKHIVDWLEEVMKKKGHYFTEYQEVRELLCLPPKPTIEDELKEALLNGNYTHETYWEDVSKQAIAFLKEKGWKDA